MHAHRTIQITTDKPVRTTRKISQILQLIAAGAIALTLLEVLVLMAATALGQDALAAAAAQLAHYLAYPQFALVLPGAACAAVEILTDSDQDAPYDHRIQGAP